MSTNHFSRGPRSLLRPAYWSEFCIMFLNRQPNVWISSFGFLKVKSGSEAIRKAVSLETSWCGSGETVEVCRHHQHFRTLESRGTQGAWGLWMPPGWESWSKQLGAWKPGKREINLPQVVALTAHAATAAHNPSVWGGRCGSGGAPAGALPTKAAGEIWHDKESVTKRITGGRCPLNAVTGELGKPPDTGQLVPTTFTCAPGTNRDAVE